MKLLLLIFTLSAPFFNSTLLFAEALFSEVTLKKELGICGKTMSTLFRISPTSEPEFTLAITFEQEFCDYGRYEENANYIISLYNAKDQLIYDKHIYINPINRLEAVDPKVPGKLKIIKVEKAPTSRTVKFPYSEAMGEIKYYSVKQIAENKRYAKKIIDWK